jgi:hypothetical protein
LGHTTLVRIEQLQYAHLRDGVVRNLPAAFAGATFHPPVAPARAVPNLQDGPEESRIAGVTVLALARVAEGGRGHRGRARLELLKVKADLERELETWVPNCTKCGLDVHWVSGLGITRDTGRTGNPRRTASRRHETQKLPVV